jgi:hypothetical protein
LGAVYGLVSLAEDAAHALTVLAAKKPGENRLPAIFRTGLGLKPGTLQVGKLGLNEKGI